MAPATLFNIQNIGGHAIRILQQERQARVVGVTSHGIFLLTDNQHILFLTSDRWHGPLTVNLDPTLSLISDIQTGDSAQLDADCISLHESRFCMDETTTRWQLIPFILQSSQQKEILERARALTALFRPEETQGLFRDISAILTKSPSSPAAKQAAVLAWLAQDMPAQQESSLEDLLLPWLGRGRGLTPAGDDMLCGLLLSHHALDRKALLNTDALLSQAKIRTTSLSTALLTCAAQGAADERLIDALVYLAGCGTQPETIQKELLSYGSSSGLDTLAGMIAAILLF